MTKVLRPHRFPPLSQFSTALVPLGSQHGSGDPAQMQASMADGFQQGLDKGYQEGYESGEDRGHQAGLAAGYQEGRQQGADEARRDVLESFDGLAKPLEAALADLARLQADYQVALRKEVIDLVAKVARQVIRCELALQPTQLLALVDETLAAMPPAPDGVDIFLNPEECQRIKELAPERASRWNLIADPRLEAGECRVKAGDREADAGCRQRLAACMTQVREHLLDADATTSTTSALPVEAPEAPAMRTQEPVAEPAHVIEKAIADQAIETAKAPKAAKVTKASSTSKAAAKTAVASQSVETKPEAKAADTAEPRKARKPRKASEGDDRAIAADTLEAQT